MTHRDMMRALVLAGLLLTSPALADDKAACADGIARLRLTYASPTPRKMK